MDINPWNVPDASAFLYFNCPECIFSSQELHNFAAHAVQNHENSKFLFQESELESMEVTEDPVEAFEPETTLTENYFDIDMKPEEGVADDLPDDLPEADYDDDNDDEIIDNDDEYEDPDPSYRPSKKAKVSKVTTNGLTKSERKRESRKEKAPPPEPKSSRSLTEINSNSDGWLLCDKCNSTGFLFDFELIEHYMTNHDEAVTIDACLIKTAKELLERDEKLAKSKWRCHYCANEVFHGSKVELLNHWQKEHKKTETDVEICQWCMELFSNDDRFMVSK